MSTERIQYIRVDTDKFGSHLVVQLAGGGAAQTFLPVDETPDVVFRLRRLADLLERGAAERAKSK